MNLLALEESFGNTFNLQCKYDPIKRNVVPNPTIWSAGADLGGGDLGSLVKYP